jgi:hypothetical protein
MEVVVAYFKVLSQFGERKATKNQSQHSQIGRKSDKYPTTTFSNGSVCFKAD